MNQFLYEWNYNPMYKCSGIYALGNIAQYRWYIGSSINLGDRADRHFHLLEQGVHGNRQLQYSFDEYGPDVFTFIVLELCGVDELTSREQIWIDRFRSHRFNIQTKAIRPEHTRAKVTRATLWRGWL